MSCSAFSYSRLPNLLFWPRQAPAQLVLYSFGHSLLRGTFSPWYNFSDTSLPQLRPLLSPAMNPHHLRPEMDLPRSPKRRRRVHTPTPPSPCDMMDIETASRPLRLQNLPLMAVKQILHHLLAPYRNSMSNNHTPLPWLRDHYPLRALCTLLRDAIDSTVSSLDLSSLPPHAHAPFLLRAMPCFPTLSALTLSPNSLSPTLVDSWSAFFVTSRATSISSLTFVPPSEEANPVSPLPKLFASALSHSLETLSTTSMPLLAALARHSSTLASLELLMDAVDPAILPSFPHLRLAKLLYRSRITASTAERLVTALTRCQPELRQVELRLNYLPSTAFHFVCQVPRLRKLSLFDGEVEHNDNLEVLGRCAFLEEVQLEWMKGLKGAHVEGLARIMGGRLKRLRIWNCEEVTDQALEAVARYCPGLELELRFEREQFHPRTLAMFGERVSWGSYAM